MEFAFAMEQSECRFGYPKTQLERILGADEMKKFLKWMRGQTFSSCTGSQYNHETRNYEPTNCGPHGFVYYSWDVERFLAGKPVID